MKIDLYTKAVLSVIALCLIYLCLRDGQTTVHAQPGGMPVIITGVNLPPSPNSGLPPALPVGIVGTLSPLPVTIAPQTSPR